MIIAICGKGGTGKTTLSALLINFLKREGKGPVLCIDADPNENLSEVLGLRPHGSIVEILDEVSVKREQIPAGMTKDRFIEYKVEEALQESQGLDLLVMGRPEGPGCYCYVNNLLRDIIGRLSRRYPFIVIDNAAGMEHLSRRTERRMDILLLVSDYSSIGVRSAVKIYNLAKELKIEIGKTALIINKSTGKIESLEKEIKAPDITFAGALAYDEKLLKSGLEAIPVYKWDMNSKVVKDSSDIFRRVLCL